MLFFIDSLSEFDDAEEIFTNAKKRLEVARIDPRTSDNSANH